jgi:5'-deoxynucleotidase YfbR-like HD superfamily hydrolase
MTNTEIINFLDEIGKLKSIKRTGWILHSVMCG